MPARPWTDPDIETHDKLDKLLAGQARIETAQKALNRRMNTMAEDVNSELAAETAEETALAAAVASNTAALTKIRADLAAALAAAANAGLTPDQVAAFQAIHDKVAGDIAAIGAADAPAAP